MVDGVQHHANAFVLGVAFVAHAEFLHDPPGSAVCGLSYCHDSIETDALEAIAHDGAGGFGRQAASPNASGPATSRSRYPAC